MKVSNKYISFFFNNFDFLIRFLYCRIPFLRRLLFWQLYSSNFKELNRQFKQIERVLKKYKINLQGKVVLEIGPGNSYINAYNFLVLGAKKVILVDKFPRLTNSKKQKLFLQQELAFFKQTHKLKNLFFIKNGKINPRYINFIADDLNNLNLKNIDFIYTNSVLEHVKNIKEIIKTMKRFLRKEGYMYHQIDMRDHYNFDNPFLFYKYPDIIWNKFLTKEGISYTNRWRYDDFIKIFEKYNFKKVWEKKKRKKFLPSVKLAKRFRKKRKENLEIIELKILLKKCAA